jgi:small subunit ribosomal protein S13
MFVFGDRILDGNKAISVVFCPIYGIGLRRSNYIASIVGVSGNLPLVCAGRFIFLICCEVIRSYYLVESSLRRRVIIYLKLKYLSNSYRYLRYSLGLPLRGQRSRSNGRTRKRLLRLGLIVPLYKQG